MSDIKYTPQEIDAVLTHAVFKHEAVKTKKEANQKLDATFEGILNTVKAAYKDSASETQKEKIINKVSELVNKI